MTYPFLVSVMMDFIGGPLRHLRVTFICTIGDQEWSPYYSRERISARCILYSYRSIASCILNPESCYPPSVIHSPSFIVYHRYSIIHHLLSIFHLLSLFFLHLFSIIHHPSSIHHSSSIIHRLSFSVHNNVFHFDRIFLLPLSILHRSSFIVHRLSSIYYHPSSIIHCSLHFPFLIALIPFFS